MKKQYKSIMTLALCTGLITSLTTPIYAYEKNETVYVSLHEDGQIKDVVVGDRLKADGEKQIQDTTNLTDIQNVNGNETFKQDGNDILWDNQEHDIYYEGKTSQSLPIQTTITYSINGEKKDLNEMKNQEGDVEIQIHLKNLDRHDDIYTPFVVTFASVLSSENNTDIQVTNGKVISNGKMSAIVAVAAPGLYESLDQNELLKDMDTVTIRYKTKKFDTMPMYAIATPKLLEEKDLDFNSRLQEMSSKLNTLQDASSKLVEGSQQLASGSHQLSSNYLQFDNGLNQLSNGANTLSNEYQTFDQGVQYLAQQSESFQSLTSLLDQLSTLKTATDSLDQGINALKQAVSTSTDPNSDINQKINSIKLDLLTKQQELITLQTNMTQLQGQLQNRVISFMSLSKNLETAISNETIDSQKTALQNIKDQLDIEITNLTNNLTQLSQGMGVLETKLTAINQDMSDLDTLSSQVTQGVMNGLNSAIGEFESGNSQLKLAFDYIQKQTANLPSLLSQFIAGTKQLSSGSTQINNALNTMNESTTTLYQANTQINQAITQLADGADTLNSGMQQFDQEGIQNISSLSNILEKAGDKADRLIQLANEYNTFTKLANDVQGDVKFVFTVQCEEDKD